VDHQTAAAPLAQTTVGGASGGDGYSVAFDLRGPLYSIYHHAPPGSARMVCMNRTGVSCGPGWTFPLNHPSGINLAAPDRSHTHVDQTNKRYFLHSNNYRY
jgi:hypothetical protein